MFKIKAHLNLDFRYEKLKNNKKQLIQINKVLNRFFNQLEKIQLSIKKEKTLTLMNKNQFHQNNLSLKFKKVKIF